MGTGISADGRPRLGGSPREPYPPLPTPLCTLLHHHPTPGALDEQGRTDWLVQRHQGCQRKSPCSNAPEVYSSAPHILSSGLLCSHFWLSQAFKKQLKGFSKSPCIREPWFPCPLPCLSPSTACPMSPPIEHVATAYQEPREPQAWHHPLQGPSAGCFSQFTVMPPKLSCRASHLHKPFSRPF